jgi:chromate transporter
MKLDTLGTLAAHFALISLFAVGGAMAVVPEMHRQAVEVSGWMTDRQFADLFAIAQAAPGPNIIVVTLIGYHAAGIPGALVATLAMSGPTCIITYYVSRAFDRFKDAHWRIVVQAGLVPVSVGLFAAGAFVIARAADTSVTLRPRRSPPGRGSTRSGCSRPPACSAMRVSYDARRGRERALR